ncbi:MAG: EAL domain-containing protein [Deltaproteobacteria bacterium]|nr:EAL domain-containing protein [Deltaproteobacteria bacterium]
MPDNNTTDGSGPARRSRILVVDDEEPVRRALGRVMRAAGYDVIEVGDGRSAAGLVADGGLDAIVSDVRMPDMDGVALLRTVRERDRDIPVILLTGTPDVSSAAEAVALGAFNYLMKPVDPPALREVVKRAIDLYRIARMKDEAFALLQEQQSIAGERAALEESLEAAIGSLYVVVQPILDRGRGLYGHEAFVRAREPRLPNPGALLEAAERLGRLQDIGRAVRAQVADILAGSDEPGVMFVNLHPLDLLDRSLYGDDPLIPHARRVMLEITERASLDEVGDVRARIAALRDLGFRIAIDDLGAGYAGLNSFAQLEPHTVKFDMALVRDVDKVTTKQRLIRSMTDLCHGMGMQVVAEGVETIAERDVLVDLGCDLFQGYLFARPGPPLPRWSWGQDAEERRG